ncbi:MAG TPA: hypothetical protein VLA28_04680 [Afifellaceae bacterium]|nr:hypothetical protein [Afifellaceae bacterium]
MSVELTVIVENLLGIGRMGVDRRAMRESAQVHSGIGRIDNSH